MMSFKKFSRFHLIAAAVFLFAAAIYAGSLYNDFVFDDQSIVLANPWIRSPEFLREMFTKNAWYFNAQTTNYYRPLVHVLLLVQYHLFGLKPWGYHLFNVLYHAFSSLLVFLIASRLMEALSRERAGRERFLSVPFMAALIFAAHPIHTEAVDWVSGQMDLSYSFLYLLALYLYLRGKNITSALVFFLSTLCKEPALTLPVLLVIIDYLRQRRLSFKRYLPFIVVGIVYFALRINALGGIAPHSTGFWLTTSQYMLSLPGLISDYIKWLILPLNLNVWHIFRPQNTFSFGVLVALAVIAAVLAAFFAAYKKDRLIFLSMSAAALPILPALSIKSLAYLSESVAAERYLYLPVFGFAMLVGLLFDLMREKFSRIAAVSFILLIALYSAGTISRNAVWRDNYSLFVDMAEKSPDAAMPHRLLGRVLLYMDGRVDDAIKEFQAALKYEPDSARIHNNLAAAYDKKGMKDKYQQEILLALNLDPLLPEPHANLGLIYLDNGRIADAINQFNIALQLKPGFEDALRCLGRAYLDAGDKVKAKYYLGQALYQNPNDTEAQALLSKTSNP